MFFFPITYMDLTVSSSVYCFMSYCWYYRFNSTSVGHFSSTDDLFHQWTFEVSNKSWLPTGVFPMTSQLLSLDTLSAYNKHFTATRPRPPICFCFRETRWTWNKSYKFVINIYLVYTICKYICIYICYICVIYICICYMCYIYICNICILG